MKLLLRLEGPSKQRMHMHPTSSIHLTVPLTDVI